MGGCGSTAPPPCACKVCSQPMVAKTRVSDIQRWCRCGKKLLANKPKYICKPCNIHMCMECAHRPLRKSQLNDMIVAERSIPLHDAVRTGDVQKLIDCLDAGEDVNICSKTKTTALHLCATNCYPEMASLLIQALADVNYQDECRYSPLHSAASSGINEDAVVLLLIAEGAVVNKTDLQDQTPLHWAARMSNEKVALALLDHGADIHAKAGAGANYYTPFAMAQDWGSSGIAKMIESRGGTYWNDEASEQSKPNPAPAVEQQPRLSAVVEQAKLTAAMAPPKPTAAAEQPKPTAATEPQKPTAAAEQPKPSAEKEAECKKTLIRNLMKVSSDEEVEAAVRSFATARGSLPPSIEQISAGMCAIALPRMNMLGAMLNKHCSGPFPSNLTASAINATTKTRERAEGIAVAMSPYVKDPQNFEAMVIDGTMLNDASFDDRNQILLKLQKAEVIGC